MYRVEVIRQRNRRSAELDALGFGRCDSLRLPLADELPLILRYEGQNLQHQVGNEGAHQVLALPGIQQRHSNDADVHIFLLGQDAPLVLHLLIIAPQPVDALNVEQVARLQLFHQLFVLRPVEILAGYLVHVNKAVLHALAVQGN